MPSSTSEGMSAGPIAQRLSFSTRGSSFIESLAQGGLTVSRLSRSERHAVQLPFDEKNVCVFESLPTFFCVRKSYFVMLFLGVFNGDRFQRLPFSICSPSRTFRVHFMRAGL